MVVKPAILVGGAVAVATALAVFAVAVPAYQGYKHRARMTEVINEASRVRSLVSDEMLARKAGAPARREFKSESPVVTRVAVDYEAKTVAAFVDPDRFGHRSVPRNASVTYTAVVEGAKIIDWKCVSDVPAKFLPANCR